MPAASSTRPMQVQPRCSIARAITVAALVCAMLALTLPGCSAAARFTQGTTARLEPVRWDARTGAAASSIVRADDVPALPMISGDRHLPRVLAAETDDPNRVRLSGAGGEWLDLTLLCEGAGLTLTLEPLTAVALAETRGEAPVPGEDDAEGVGAAGPAGPHSVEWRAYHVAEVPADLNRAAYVRWHGAAGDGHGEAGDATVTTLPRALVPLRASEAGFRVNEAPDGAAAKIWVDIELPRGLERGTWRTAVVARDARGRERARVPVIIESHGFDLPRQRSLVVSGELRWEQLAAHWPEVFGGMLPQHLSRTEERSGEAIDLLDRLMLLAQRERLQLTLPDLAPVVKWPAGRGPEADWRDYDSVVLPWLTGSLFADGEGVHDWPAPRATNHRELTDVARAQYWRMVLSHFDEWDLLRGSVVEVEPGDVGADLLAARGFGGLSPAERLNLSAEAGAVARAYEGGRIAVPLELDQVRFEGPQNPGLMPPEGAGRLLVAADGLVTDRRGRGWPAGLDPPQIRLDVRAPGPAPLPGAGASPADVRLWAWLAFLRDASHLRVGPALPSTPDLQRPADPMALVWFYPGEAFGHDAPVPSIHLKWLRRAQQDYEYLLACSERLEETYARVIARALVRPVRVGVGERVDPMLPLVTGTPAETLWDQGLELVAGKIATVDEQIRRTLAPRFMADHTNVSTAWLARREMPLPILSRLHWDLASGADGVPRVFLRAGVGIYNASDLEPEGLVVGWSRLPGESIAETGAAGEGIWSAIQREVEANVATYEVVEQWLNASAPVEGLEGMARLYMREPAEVFVRDAFTGRQVSAEVVAPVAVLHRRSESPRLDGSLDDWTGEEALVDGPMVRLIDRRALQAGQVALASRPTQVFAAWTPQGLHLAFRAEGTQQRPGGEQVQSFRNFIETQERRAWGEDVCQIVLQPVWLGAGEEAEPIEGPLLHVVCKPQGAFAERRLDRRTEVELWRPFESGLRYAATVDEEGIWRGEVLVPWSSLRTDGLTLGTFGSPPAMLRFNLTHHHGASGESSSWAGPVDFGRDERITGVLILR